jgi:hypothetical protein
MPLLLGVAVVGAAVALSGGLGLGPGAGPGASLAVGASGPTGELPGTEPTPTPLPTPRPPLGGTELYGYLPYWQMTPAMATYLDASPVSTLGLFSVTARSNGAIDTRPVRYRRITGDIGRRLIADAHRRKSRVELVFASFGETRNGVLLGRLAPTSPAPSSAIASRGPLPSPTPAAPTPTPTLAPPPAIAPWHRTVDELVKLANDLGVDGVNVDIERLDPIDLPAYGAFLSALRAGIVASNPKARLTVATEAGINGTGNAVAAIAAGADRVFLMGYEYHWSGSQPGGSSPIDRNDGMSTLRWSIDRYVEAGVPRNQILLGLPLYGMTWRMTGPDRTAFVVGTGVAWIPNNHLDLLLDSSFTPSRDPLELAEFFSVPDGAEWLLTYYDSPATLRPKLALARDSGLAGAGFWALGYERGLPGYTKLMATFRDGKVAREEAPPRP